MHNELIINCPQHFEKCQTHFEKLVEMQHYGLPTRLLDITRNPLVALYFACIGESSNYGELVLIAADSKEIKYPQSDTISILASLPFLSHEAQIITKSLASNPAITEQDFNNQISVLMQEIRLEKPAFNAEVRKKDLLSNFVVFAIKNNNRIIKQDGAFIICGLKNYTNAINDFRYREQGKLIIVLINNKAKILQQLEAFSINHATLFPEIECVSEYIKKKYRKND